ncbi:Cytochrome P450 [Macleaya cordata]|uniref:Cytochrome P450 n=1 Tax=Macleaya cordata TaxID=56857 RepID=A0A200Q5W9_MACCD|nr:Cytochrome P450 [Macleaya cordata]
MTPTTQTTLSSGESTRNVCSRQLLLHYLPEVHFFELFLAFILFVSIHYLRQRKHHALPVWPFVGMFPSLLIGIHAGFYDWLTSTILDQPNATFTYIGVNRLNCVFTANPRNVEHILKTKFSNFRKGEFFRTNTYDLLGDGIFNANGEIWHRQRKTASLEFHSPEYRNMTTESLIELVHSRLLLVLEDSIKQLSAVAIDLQELLLRLTFDNICMIAFGVDPGCLRPGLPEIPFARAFEDATEGTVFRFVTPTFIWKAMKYLNMGVEKKLKNDTSQVDKFAEEVIQTRKKELSLEQSNDTKLRSDLLTVFMRLKDDQGKPFSDKFLRDICVNLILAGRDTSSVALSWFFWLLDQNPAVEKRILEEIYGLIAERKNSNNEESKNSVIFMPEEVKKMDYLQAALSEALRLYPSVPLGHKEVDEDDVFPDGTLLKKGTKVVYATYTMGRMESIWGKDCREYKPERWLRDGRFTSESAYKFTAFNGGPRLCLGKDFAYYQMKFVAASIIYRYRVKVVENHLVSPKLALTMYMKYGLKVTLSRRDDDHNT